MANTLRGNHMAVLLGGPGLGLVHLPCKADKRLQHFPLLVGEVHTLLLLLLPKDVRQSHYILTFPFMR